MERFVAKTGDEAAAHLAKLNWSVIALDTETTALEYMKLEATGYSVTDGRRVVYVDLMGQPNGIKILGEFLKRTHTVVCHNFVFDAKVLHKYGISLEDKEIFDTMVASHLIDENRVDRRLGGTGHGLKQLAKDILEVDVVKYADAEKAGIHSDLFYEYAQNDAIWTWELCHIFRNELLKQNLVTLFREIEMPFLKTLLEMEINGVLVDLKKTKQIAKQLQERIMDLEIKLHEIAGLKYQMQSDLFGNLSIVSKHNFNSTKQLVDILTKLGLEVTTTTKTGNASVGKTALLQMKGKHEFVEVLEQYKAAQKLLTAFFDPLPKFVDSDGRVRPNFRDTGTVTGRLACDHPNLQQLPKENKTLGVNTRSVFVASPGKKMIACDYSQQEIRIMTELSQDPTLIKIILEKGDLHLINANTVFKLGIPEEKLYEGHEEYEIIKKKYKKDRDKGKVFSFGIPYGMSWAKLSRDFGVTEEEAKVLLNNFFSGFPSLERAIRQCHLETQKNLYVTTMAGRRRHFTKDSSGRLDGKALRQSFNFLIQSYGADLIRMSCIKISKYAKEHPEYGVKLLMTVHDEVVLECNESFVQQVMKDVEQLMESCASMCVPLKAEATSGNDYGQCK